MQPFDLLGRAVLESLKIVQTILFKTILKFLCASKNSNKHQKQPSRVFNAGKMATENNL